MKIDNIILTQNYGFGKVIFSYSLLNAPAEFHIEYLCEIFASANDLDRLVGFSDSDSLIFLQEDNLVSVKCQLWLDG